MTALRLPRGSREAALAAAAALAVMLTAWLPGAAAEWRRLETESLDLRFRMRGVLPPRPDIALVMVDEASLARLGRWPFSRHLMARAVERLDAAGAKLIVFDQLFAEPETAKPADLRDIAREAAAALPPGADTGTLRARLAALASDDPDGDFAAVIRKSGKVLLPFAFSFHPETDAGASTDVDLSDSGYQILDRGAPGATDPLQPRAVLAPVAGLREAAAGLGGVNVIYDVDGLPRYDYVSTGFNGDILPSIAVRAAAASAGVPWNHVRLALGQSVRFGARTVPVDLYGRMLVNYRGPRRTFQTDSFADLIEDKLPHDRLAGHIVILGASFVGNADSHGSPFGREELPGSELWANAIATMLDGDFIRELPLSLPLQAATVLLAALVGAVAARLPTRSIVLAGVLPPAVWSVAAHLAFCRGWWLPLAQPVAALAVAAVATLLLRYWVTDRDRRRIKATFKRYMAPKLVDLLAANPERVKLGGEMRRMTLLFCDVRGFTAIAEAYAADPQGLTRLINRFLTPMTDIILAAGGTIDKYMGDCIMAFWNAPLDNARHADLACGAALAMRAALAGLNRELAAEAEGAGRKFHELRIGVGLNTGDCVVGNMGSEQRLDYSVLGDPVNLASRLEGQSKTYGVDIVIGEATRDAAPAWAALELDRIAVKGKRAAVRIYALIGDEVLAGSPAFRELAECHAGMLASYRAQDWQGAETRLAEEVALAPELAVLQALYGERIRHFAAHPPGPEWDGTFVAESK